MINCTDYLRIGLIVRPHGVKGTLKIEPETFDNSRFSVLCDAYLENKGTYTPIEITSSSCNGSTVLINIKGITTRDQAEALRNQFICVDRQHAAQLPDGKYFITDMIGCTVFDSLGNKLGILSDCYQYPANDVYEIKSNGRTLTVPALNKLLKSVNTQNKEIIFDKVTLDEVGIYNDIN